MADNEKDFLKMLAGSQTITLINGHLVVSWQGFVLLTPPISFKAPFTVAVSFKSQQLEKDTSLKIG